MLQLFFSRSLCLALARFFLFFSFVFSLLVLLLLHIWRVISHRTSSLSSTSTLRHILITSTHAALLVISSSAVHHTMRHIIIFLILIMLHLRWVMRLIIIIGVLIVILVVILSHFHMLSVLLRLIPGTMTSVRGSIYHTRVLHIRMHRLIISSMIPTFSSHHLHISLIHLVRLFSLLSYIFHYRHEFFIDNFSSFYDSCRLRFLIFINILFKFLSL